MSHPDVVPDGQRLSEGHPRAFMCYAHESDQHEQDVLRLAECLHDAGIGVIIDVDTWPVRCDWQIWATRHILASDYVLVVASPTARRAGDGLMIDARPHLGLQAEMRTLRELYTADYRTWSRRMLPVVLPDISVHDIPWFLQPYNADRYPVASIDRAGIKNLLGTLRCRRHPLAD